MMCTSIFKNVSWLTTGIAVFFLARFRTFLYSGSLLEAIPYYNHSNFSVFANNFLLWGYFNNNFSAKWVFTTNKILPDYKLLSYDCRKPLIGYSRRVFKIPETKPASEYIDGKIIQTPYQNSPIQTSGKFNRHDQWSGWKTANRLCLSRIALTFGGRSIVPDVAVFGWEQIELDENGEPVDDVFIAPAWTIEILSPEQSSNRVIPFFIGYACS